MDPPSQPEVVVQGTAASQGIAYGQVFLYVQRELDLPQYQIEPTKRMEEIARFERALVDTRKDVSRVRAEVARNLGEDEAKIFDAHLLVLEDQALISETIRELETTGLNIELCFHQVSQRYIDVFAAIPDEYLRERVADIRDVTKRLLHTLLGQATMSLGSLAQNRIVVANDISPSDAASIDRSNALAIVTDLGSRTSHAVIVARSMKIPAIVGAQGLTQKVRDGTWVIADGYDGLVILNPSEQTLFRYGKLQEKRKTVESRIMAVNQLPAETLDGVRVTLLANIEKAAEVDLVRFYNADGVGLFRTEASRWSSRRRIRSLDSARSGSAWKIRCCSKTSCGRCCGRRSTAMSRSCTRWSAGWTRSSGRAGSWTRRRRSCASAASRSPPTSRSAA